MCLTERPESSCPYIELPATWQNYLGSLRAHTRKNWRQYGGWLQKDHLVAFRKYAGDTDLRAEMEPLFILHKKRWRQKGFTSKFTSTVEQDFYYDVSKLFWQNGWLNLSFLDVDGKSVSAVWGFDYAAYGIGTIYVARRIEDYFRNGRTKFDFLKGDESYKFRWARHTVNNVQITMTKRGIAERSRIMLLDVLPKISLFRPASLWRRTMRYLKIHKKGKQPGVES